MRLAGKELEGITPLTVRDLQPREYLLELKKDGVFFSRKTVTVESDRYLTVEAVLSRMLGAIDVSSMPPEATILLDGLGKGTTPKILNQVTAGKHLLVLWMPGYAKWRKEIFIKEDELQQNVVAALQKLGSISVDSVPQGAAVSVNGSVVGTTPFRRAVDPGSYAISLKKDGMDPVARDVEVKPGLGTTLTVTMVVSEEEMARRRKAAEEVARKRAEEEKRRIAALEAARKRAEEEAARRAAAQAAKRRAEEEARRRAAAEAARRRAKEEAQRQAAAEAARKQKEADAARKRAEALSVSAEEEGEKRGGRRVTSAPIYRRWWFWTLIGAAAAGGTAGIIIGTTTHGGDSWVASGADGRFTPDTFLNK